MAGDWIKVEKATPRKPEILRIAAALEIHPDHAFGLCFRFWSWCDDHLDSTNARGVSSALVDSIVERKGFAIAMIEVDWLRVNDGSLEIPNMDRHLSQTAKKRAVTAQRVAKHAAKTNARGVSTSVSGALPIEEKRREDTSGVPEVNTPTPFFDFEGLNPAIRTLRKPDGDMLTFEEDHLVWQHEFLKRWNKLPGVSKHAESCLGDFELRMLLERFQERDWNWQEAMAMFPINWPGSLSLVTFLERGKVQQIVGGKYKIPDFSNRVTVAQPKKDIFAGLRASEEKARNEESVFESS